jgi:rubrerythrin
MPSQLEKDVNCHKCWYQLEFRDERDWPEICPICGRKKDEIKKLEKRYYEEE